MEGLSRRRILGAAGALALGFADAPTRAAAEPDLLARLRTAKKARVGIANQPPFSSLNPDGSITGLGPTIAKTVMTRLGVPEIEGFIATYGQLIPGMLAGRWDFVAACLTITKARCSQVRFCDPLALDGDTIVARKGGGAKPPNRVADLAKLNVPIGVQAGGADLRAALAAGVSPSNIRQFPNDPSIIDGLLANRVDYALMASSALQTQLKRRAVDLAMQYPVEDVPSIGSACAFRNEDDAFYAAFQKELRAMKASGEFLEIVRQFGFATPPELIRATAAQVCSA